MTKLDVTNVPRELDALIASSANPRHRQILEVVRRHYILELTGRLDELFDPGMVVDEPVYYLNLDGTSRTLHGKAEVMAFYKEVEGVVLACEETVHAVSDAGYWAESWFNFYLPGAALGLDESRWYRKRQWIAMTWPFDGRARLIGERVFEHTDIGEVVPVEAADVITMDEVRALLDPLLRPLPAYPGG